MVDAFVMRFSTSVQVERLWIGVLTKQDSHLLDRILNALRLIEQYDALKYKRLLADVDRIWVTQIPGSAGGYDSDRRLVLLDSRVIEEAEDEVIASIIVHEATHARLSKFGYEESLRGRIERCCIKREIAFARRHSLDAGLISGLSEELSHPDEFYSNAANSLRHREGELALARELGVPETLVQLAHRWRDRRAKGVAVIAPLAVGRGDAVRGYE